MPPVVFVFLDGVGLDAPGEANPLSSASMKATARLLGGPLVAGAEQSHNGLLLAALDAQLGVEGIPQSATGQVSLFTGVNAAQRLGYHLPAYPNAPLQELVRERSVLRRATDRGYQATFANAYSPLYFAMIEKTNRRMSATTHAVLGAGIPFRWLSDLEKGCAVYWDMTNEHLAEQYDIDIPIIPARQAGTNLAHIARSNDLVLYETFLTDRMGHKKRLDEAAAALERLDDFLDGLWSAVSPETTVVISSDHGNIEDLRRAVHTRNPVPLLVTGPGTAAFRSARSITDVAAGIMEVLDR